MLDGVFAQAQVQFEEMIIAAQSGANVPEGLLDKPPLLLDDGAERSFAIMSLKNSKGEQIAVRADAQLDTRFEERVVVVSEDGEPADGFMREQALIVNALAQRLRADATPEGLWPDLSASLTSIKRPRLSHSAGNRRVRRIGEQAS